MKYYTVYFVIRKNSHGYLNEKTVNAKNQREAIKKVKEDVYNNSGRNAFNCTCKKPEKTSNGMIFDGKWYTSYSELFNMLW